MENKNCWGNMRTFQNKAQFKNGCHNVLQNEICFKWVLKSLKLFVWSQGEKRAMLSSKPSEINRPILVYRTRIIWGAMPAQDTILVGVLQWYEGMTGLTSLLMAVVWGTFCHCRVDTGCLRCRNTVFWWKNVSFQLKSKKNRERQCKYIK
jgi:hypothetical protein